jgi:hypothetical protein
VGTVLEERKAGKFKELFKLEEPRQGGLVVPFRSVLVWRRIWYRFVLVFDPLVLPIIFAGTLLPVFGAH